MCSIKKAWGPGRRLFRDSRRVAFSSGSLLASCLFVLIFRQAASGLICFLCVRGWVTPCVVVWWCCIITAVRTNAVPSGDFLLVVDCLIVSRSEKPKCQELFVRSRRQQKKSDGNGPSPLPELFDHRRLTFANVAAASEATGPVLLLLGGCLGTRMPISAIRAALLCADAQSSTA